jgi:ectoine hydroxylase-related dioxygenase (phytanoyl-CoA dioxygenase family)
MAYPKPTKDQIDFFREHGWLVVEDAVPSDHLDELDRHCDAILAEKERLANDWAWDAKESKDQRSFRIVQSSPSFVWKDIKEAPYRKWLVAFASELMNLKLDFWYDQFLAKPPGKSVPTYWHQDEGYWGTNLFDKGITCWIPLQDVNAQNGCMHFIDKGHKDGVLPHHLVEGMASDLLTCEVDESRTIVCPIKRGSVTFHHSKTPHMTTANTSQAWRKAVTNHMQMQGAGGEGGHYPWKIYVNQRTGERIVPKQTEGVPEQLLKGRRLTDS